MKIPAIEARTGNDLIFLRHVRHVWQVTRVRRRGTATILRHDFIKKKEAAVRHLLPADAVGSGAIAVGLCALWLLLAGNVAPAAVADGLVVAIAAAVWVRLVAA